MSRFVSARPGPKDSVIYTDSEGNEWSYSGGDRSWRNNNPGDLVPGEISRRNGAIGKAGPFAVFPDYDTGHRALLDCLRTTYNASTITRLARHYAPPGENNTRRYERFLRSRTGVKGNEKVGDLSKEQFERLWKAIEAIEGGKPGKITLLTKKKINGVRRDKKGTIVAYLIEGLGWVPKSEGIRLARLGTVDAVVATSRSGKTFLRSRPDGCIENNLGSMA